MKNKLLQVKFIPALLVFLIITAPVSANEIIRLNQFNNYLKQAQELSASKKPQEAQEALQQAKEKIHTTLLVKALKNGEIEQTEKEIGEIKQIVEIVEPQYSVIINSIPTLNSYGFTYEANITNINAMPYITNFGLCKCNFIDGENNKYSGNLSTEIVFNQAILPDKSQDFLTKDAGISIQGLDNTTEGLRKCLYDDRGNKECNLITNLKIIDCIGHITTDGKQASNCWGRNPIKVVFPL